jgi:hypothetical protein
MITSRQILEATGLKNAKTLTRWYRRAAIPEPLIRTHPSGRGKIAYWPDWVLDRCKRIVELQRQGHTLGTALAKIEEERILGLLEGIKGRPIFPELLSEKKIALPSGGETDLLLLLNVVIAREASNVAANEEAREELVAAMQSAKAAGWGLQLLSAGYNPVCIFDGSQARIVPDFIVGHMLVEQNPSAPAWIVIPLLAPLQKAFATLGLMPPPRPRAEPAPKIWSREGGAIVEYDVFVFGYTNFEIIRETAKTISVSAPERSENGNKA